MQHPLARLAPLLALLVTLTACTNLSGTDGLEYLRQPGNVVQVPQGEREDPVELSGVTLDGDRLDLADLLGEVVVVNFWWSECPPCRREAHVLVEAATTTKAEFVGINIRDRSDSAAQAFEKASDVPYPSLYSPGGEAVLAFGPRFAPRAPPTTLILDRSGRVAALISGEIRSLTTLSDLIEEVADEAPGT